MTNPVWQDGHNMPRWDAKDIVGYYDGVEVDIYGYDGDPFNATYNQDANQVNTNGKGQSIVLHNENRSGNISIQVSRVSRMYQSILEDKDRLNSEHTLVLMTPAETVTTNTAVLSKDSDISASINASPNANLVFHCGDFEIESGHIYSN